MSIRNIVAVTLVIMAGQVNFAWSQRQPVKPRTPFRPATQGATPTPAPTPKSVSPAEAFYNEGLKCDAKDYDCQVSNFTKAINLNLNTKAVFQKRAAAYMGREDFEKAIGDLTRVIELDLNDATGFKNRGTAYLSMRRTQENLQNAIKDLSSAIDLEPKDGESYSLRAKAYEAMGNLEKAKADFEKLAVLNPNDESAQANRATGLLTAKNYAEALTVYNGLIATRPKDVALLANRVQVYLGMNKYDLALADLGKILEMDPKNAVAYTIRANILERRGQFYEAIEDVSKGLSENPNSADLFYRRGRLYYAVGGHSDDALDDLSKAIALNGRFAKAFELRCSVYVGINELDSANEDCTQAISLDSESESAYGMSAQAKNLKSEGKDPAASAALQPAMMRGYTNTLRHADKVLEVSPNDVDLLIQRCQAHLGLRNYDKAVSDGTQAISLDPKSVSAYYCRGSARSALGQKDGAAQDFISVLDIDPTSMLGSSIGYFAEPAKAVILITRLIETHPKSAALFGLRGKIYADNLKDSQNAILDFKKADELYIPGKNFYDAYRYLDSMRILASLYFDMKNPVEAFATLNRAVERNPNNGYAYSNRALYYQFKLKDNAKAISDYKKAAELEPSMRYLSNVMITGINELEANEMKYALAEKERKSRARRESANALFGLAGVVVDTVVKSKQNSGSSSSSTSTTSPASSPANSGSGTYAGAAPAGNQTNSASCSQQALKGIIFGGSGVDCHQYLMPGATVGTHSVTPGTWENCSGPDENNMRHCWGPWQQSGLSQISFRLSGPAKERTTRDNPYIWTVGFKNTSNAIVKFSPEIIFGDGESHPGGDYGMAPGDEAVWHVTFGTRSSSSAASIRIRRYAICSNISRTADGYVCN